MSRSLFLWFCFASFLFWGCSGQTPYTAGDSLTRQATDTGVETGGILAGGVGGYFLGQKYLGGTTGGIVGAIGGSSIGYGLTQFYDQKRADAYAVGVQDGASAGRAKIVNQVWQREAVFALPPPWEASATSAPTIRNVYVPARNIDGVDYHGDYQRVPVYK
jgi:hypothetical protein